MTMFILVAAVLLILILGFLSLAYFLITKHTTIMESKTRALDIFLYVGIFISLVVSVTNIISILFTAIERKFTDVLEVGRYVRE